MRQLQLVHIPRLCYFPRCKCTVTYWNTCLMHLLNVEWEECCVWRIGKCVWKEVVMDYF